MKTNLLRLLFMVSLITGLMFSATQCSKKDDTAQNDIQEQVQLSLDNDKVMNPGPDPVFEDYQQDASPTLRVGRPLAIVEPSWERRMYIDKTDTIYNNAAARGRLARYLKKYGFTGIYMYSTSSIVSSTSNYSMFGAFLKTLADSGISFRGVVNGGSTTFGATGNVTKYNSAQSDPAKKVNLANLELEWWNGASTWSNWNTINQQVAAGSIIDNDFYEGWYKNMGSTIDTIAARDQVRYSDRILLHDYVTGVPTYSYANARSSGATAGRLDIIAKGARLSGKKIDLYIIISAENTAWGASNTFTGPVLAAARSQPNPFQYIESQAFADIDTKMTAFQKQWINFKGFVWFTKRYCYYAVPPM